MGKLPTDGQFILNSEYLWDEVMKRDCCFCHLENQTFFPHMSEPQTSKKKQTNIQSLHLLTAFFFKVEI